MITKSTCAAMLIASLLGTAHAASFHLNYEGDTTSIAATLTADSLGGGEWLVTGLTGTVTDNGGSEAMTLISGGPSPFSYAAEALNADNVLYFPVTSGTFFDLYGLAFSASNLVWDLCGGTGFAGTLGCQGPYTLFWENPSGFNGGGNDQGTATVTVPEPSTWAMLGLGFAGLAFAGYRSHKAASIAS